MINFIVGLIIGGAGSIFVYRNNESKLSSLADKIDEIYKQLKDKVNEK